MTSLLKKLPPAIIALSALLAQACSSPGQPAGQGAFPERIPAGQSPATRLPDAIEVLQKLSDGKSEFLVVQKPPQSKGGNPLIAVYAGRAGESPRLAFSSELPPKRRQSLSYRDAPGGVWQGFKNAALEDGKLNLYLEYLVIESPFGDDNQFFRYLEDRLWKSVDIQKANSNI